MCHARIEQDLHDPESRPGQGEDPCVRSKGQVLAARHDGDHEPGDRRHERRREQAQPGHSDQRLLLDVAGAGDHAWERRHEDRLGQEEHRARYEGTGRVQPCVVGGQVPAGQQHVHVRQRIEGDEGVGGVPNLDEELPRPLLARAPRRLAHEQERAGERSERGAQGQADHRGAGAVADPRPDDSPDDTGERGNHVERPQTQVALGALEKAKLSPRHGERDEGEGDHGKAEQSGEVQRPAEQGRQRQGEGCRQAADEQDSPGPHMLR